LINNYNDNISDLYLLLVASAYGTYNSNNIAEIEDISLKLKGYWIEVLELA
jgi:hypothetical protein